MPTALEEFTAEVSRHVFLREFSFDKNKFHAACGSEFELADHIITLPDETFVFQIKERNSDAASDKDAMLKWFQKKVLQEGCRQLRDSEKYLREQPSLLVENQRGHKFDLAKWPDRIVKILLHSATGTNLPESVSSCRHKVSGRAGFVHVLNVRDYYHVCHCLAAPRELSEYFKFRQEFLQSAVEKVPDEPMLTAMFIAELRSPMDPREAREILDRTVSDVPSFDLGPILRQYAEKIADFDGNAENLEYYKILDEFSRLYRSELRSLKKLFFWALENAGADELETPCRMLGSSKTGFVVIPVPAGAFNKRLNALRNFTTLVKYDWKLERAMGVSFARDNGTIELDWCLISGSWDLDYELEHALKTKNPFRPTPEPKIVFRYPC